jgi:hypothetical protein
MRITGLKKPKYDAVDARTIGLAAAQCSAGAAGAVMPPR